MKKIKWIGLIGLIGLMGMGPLRLSGEESMEKKQLQKSVATTIEILKEIEKARISYGEDSIVYATAAKKLGTKKARSDFVVWYYNYLTMIENDPDLPENEKKIWENLILTQANRICSRAWLQQTKKTKVDKEFLEYHLTTDRFLNLVLRVFEKCDDDITATEEFFAQALADLDPLDYVLRDLRENIQIVKLRRYQIKKGDTLSNVFGKKWRKIAEYNGIKDPAKLQVGQIIIIPERTINIPKDIDKTTQFCVLAADKLVRSDLEKTIVAEVTLAVIRVESSEGRYIGTGTYHLAMNPSEKIEFLKICQRLGIDPETAPVSKKPSYGWGGAMGPGQFLSSTWTACEADVCLMANEKFVSPYNLKHAIFATASKLVASGVASGGNDAIERAVMRYFAGKNWDKKEYSFYWDKRVEPELDKIRKNEEIRKLIFSEETKETNKNSS